MILRNMRRACIVLGACVFVALMRGVPRRLRFPTAAHLAILAGPLVHALRPAIARLSLGLERSRDVTLYFLLHHLTLRGVPFDIDATNPELEPLVPLVAAGGGVLLVGTHATLTRVFLRLLHDRGMTPTVVSACATEEILGTAGAWTTLQPGAHHLLRMRNALKKGQLVCAEIDVRSAVPGRTSEVTYGPASIHVRDELLKVAAQCGTPVVFCAARLNGAGRLVTELEAAPESARGDSEAVVRHFAAFTLRQMSYAAPQPLPQAAAIRLALKQR